jgi:peptide-methionine (S)-S-oxide reductase
VFYHNDAQRKLALETRDREAAKRKRAVATEIVPLKVFYLAEDYHQTHFLRQQSEVLREFQAMFPDAKRFLASTAAARINAYLSGNGSEANLQREIGSLGLSPRGRQIVMETWKRQHR